VGSQRRLARLEHALGYVPPLPPLAEFRRLPPAVQRHYLLTRLPPETEEYPPREPPLGPEDLDALIDSLVPQLMEPGPPETEEQRYVEALQRLQQDVQEDLAGGLRPWVEALPPAEREKLAGQIRRLPEGEHWRLRALPGT
jgi:hypothetical protein